MLSALKSEIEFLDSQFHKYIALIPIYTPINYKIDLLCLKKVLNLVLSRLRNANTHR